jgi:hypothetical protein
MPPELLGLPTPRRVAVERSAEERELDAVLAIEARVRAFRRAVEPALRSLGLSLNAFQVLEGTDRLERELRDAVSQQDVARECGLGKSLISKHMRELHRRRLVDIGFDQWGYAQRIILSGTGTRSLATARRAIVVAAREARLLEPRETSERSA